jgi:hypothetical protein
MTSTTTMTMLAWAAVLNIPIVVAATTLPLGAVIASSVAMTLIGAILDRLVGWSFPAAHHELIELFPAVDRHERQAA